MDKPKEGFFYNIPASVFEADIPDKAKLLFGLLSSLLNKEGYCYASNDYLSKKLKLNSSDISRYLTILGKLGTVQIENRQSKWRKVTLCFNTKYFEEKHKVLTEKPQTSIKESIKESIPDGQTRRPERYSPEKQTVVHRLAYYLEDKTGSLTTAWGKQGAAVKRMTGDGYAEDDIKKVIAYMARDKWWSEKGFDLATVGSQIQKVFAAMKLKEQQDAWQYSTRY